MAIRDTQEVIVVPAQPTDPAIRNTQEAVSVVSVPTDPTIRSTQELFMALALPSDDKIRVTQHVLLVIEQRYFNPNQYRIPRPITAWQVQPEIRQPFGFPQSAALLGATAVYINRPFGILTATGVHEEEHANQPWIGRVPAARRRRPLGWVVS